MIRWRRLVEKQRSNGMSLRTHGLRKHDMLGAVSMASSVQGCTAAVDGPSRCNRIRLSMRLPMRRAARARQIDMEQHWRKET
jgi:hypothetical protein